MNRNSTLWLFAILTFGVGDLLTTGYGLQIGLVENHPLYHSLPTDLVLPLAFIVKLLVMAVFLTLYRLVPSHVRVGVPIGLSLLGTGITAWNSYLILSVV